MSNLIQGYQIAIPFLLSGSDSSLLYSGSQLIITGSVESSQGFTGSLYGTASWAENANVDTSSLATTGSNTFIGNQTITGSLYTSGTIVVLYEDAFKNSIYTSGSLFVGYDGGFSNDGFIEVIHRKNNFSGLKITTTESIDSIYRDTDTGNFYIKNIEFGSFSSSMFIEPANGHELIIKASTSGSNKFSIPVQITGSLNISGALDVSYQDAQKNSIYTDGGIVAGKQGYVDNDGSGYTQIIHRETNLGGLRIFRTGSQDSIFRDFNANAFFIRTILDADSMGQGSGSIYIEPAYSDKLIIRSSSPNGGGYFIASEITGSLTVTNGITGSLYGTASWAQNVAGLNLSQISTGSVTASVNVGPDGIFLIQSSSQAFVEISGSSNTNFYSDLFIVKNFTDKQPVLTVSQSIVQIATHSIDPSGTTQAGSIWFTSASMYIGLE